MGESRSNSVRFQIGEAFPATDPVARWVTVLAMASNDFSRIFSWAESAPDAGTRILAFRLQAATLYEVFLHLGNTLRAWPEVQAFVEQLDPSVQEDLERIRGALDSESPHFLGAWIKDHRNTTFHYPKMNRHAALRGAEELQRALLDAACLEGEMRAEDDFAVFGYADEVVVQQLPDADENHAPELEALREPALALRRLAYKAVGAYLRALPDGVLRWPADD